jgi:hypothetical protein
MVNFSDEIIESIKCVNDEYYYSGIAIKTNKQTLLFLIDNRQSGCENYGVRITDAKSFTLFEYVGDDNCDNFYIHDCDHEYDENCNGFKGDGNYNGFNGERLVSLDWFHKSEGMSVHCASFKFKTTNKEFILSIWNEHEGHYPHTYKVVCKWFNDTDIL